MSLKTFDLSYFCGKNHFEEDGTQNWFIFQPMGRYLEVVYTNDINYVLSWKSKGLSNLEIDSIKTNNHLLNPFIDTKLIPSISSSWRNSKYLHSL